MRRDGGLGYSWDGAVMEVGLRWASVCISKGKNQTS